jgi:SAM-dependent methyltransferase
MPLLIFFQVGTGQKNVEDCVAVDFYSKHESARADAVATRTGARVVGKANATRLSPENAFAQKLREVIAPGDRVFDAGCGTGKFFGFDFARAAGCQLVGADVRQDVKANPEMDFCIRSELERLPFLDASFDVVNCRLVIEHVDSPDVVLREFYRVLKPGGRMALFTPNLLHYFGAAARLTPHWFHVWFNSRVRGFDQDDIFSTYYRANTRRRLRRLALEAGFSRAEIGLVEGAPSVLEFNSLLHRMGLGYEWLVNRYDFLSDFRLNIIAVAYKG